MRATIVLPNTPLFSRLLRHASRGRSAVRDDDFGVEKSYTELLSDVLAIRKVLQDVLSQEVLVRLRNEKEVYTGVLAPGGYEYTVAMLAVIAIGAATVPMTVTLPVEEAAYFVTKSKQVAILTAASSTNLGQEISSYVKSQHLQTVETLSILPNLPRGTMKHSSMVISSNQYLRPELASLFSLSSFLALSSNSTAAVSILLGYGATEFAAVFMVELDPKGTPDGSVGKHLPGINVKLSEGDEGEVLVRSSQMFSKYLYDDAATVAVYDEEGFFRTGDIARRNGDYYWIMGRASLDIIKSGGYKISALDIERELLSLPYISEAMVVGVADLEFGQRVAALVTLRDDQSTFPLGSERRKLTIDGLRKELRSKLAGYKMPTVLRIFVGELTKGQSGKVQKKLLGPDMFPSPGWETHPNVQVWKKPSDQRSRL
ncbi:hypothetical protein BKA65DRAFT_581645 [Rhexocercosporidium sp. MPI-PUGE-AT-0058]|nr:hypothetical protein BKA65DRAFT_581645 [Rhexocercosporidium sp. MPI-PUGE-AT-0058]